ncbi:MAG: hypothetical protein COV67_10520, partial [Nitrospinae bacterium CG11_big_fil_rev_8_21_14_0_20_56_8]
MTEANQSPLSQEKAQELVEHVKREHAPAIREHAETLGEEEKEQLLGELDDQLERLENAAVVLGTDSDTDGDVVDMLHETIAEIKAKHEEIKGKHTMPNIEGKKSPGGADLELDLDLDD